MKWANWYMTSLRPITQLHFYLHGFLGFQIIFNLITLVAKNWFFTTKVSSVKIVQKWENQKTCIVCNRLKDCQPFHCQNILSKLKCFQICWNLLKFVPFRLFNQFGWLFSMPKQIWLFVNWLGFKKIYLVFRNKIEMDKRKIET